MTQRERVALQPGYLLHARDYRESSRILEVFSRDKGRVGLVAKGARRPRSPLKAALQPFQPTHYSWSGGELATLTGAEASATPWRLNGDALLSGYYVNELLMRLTLRHDPHPDVFETYEQTLAALQSGEISVTLRRFEHRLLMQLGYGLNLVAETGSGTMVESERWYQYHADHGPRELAAHAEGAVQGKMLLAMANDDYSLPETMKVAKRLYREAIDAHLGGKPLKSRKVLHSMKKQ